MNEHDMRLALHVALRMDDYRVSFGCPAWIESADRMCGKEPVRGYLCNRHHNVAVKRQGKALDEAAKKAREREAYRAKKLPEWKAELEKVNAEIERRDQPVVRDRAAVGGNTHPSIWKKQKAALSDTNVKRMADLWRRHEHLTKLIGSDA